MNSNSLTTKLKEIIVQELKQKHEKSLVTINIVLTFFISSQSSCA